MQLIQFHHETGGRRVGAVKDGRVYDLTSSITSYNSFMAMLDWAGGRSGVLAEMAEDAIAQVRDQNIHDWEELDHAPGGSASHLMIPLTPPEVWGFGVTYQRSAEARDADVARTLDASASIYDRVYHAERPECFFKATSARCVGPYEAIGIRSDSQLTATEPELAYVLGKSREIVGYTICNDVSAWDLERENPLYLPQSKIFTGCCALGPAITLAAGGPDPYSLKIECRIIREGQEIYRDATSSGKIGRRFEELNECLYRDNPIPAGTVVSTGTGIMVPNEMALRDGDLVEIEIEGIGILRNKAVQLKG